LDESLGKREAIKRSLKGNTEVRATKDKIPITATKTRRGIAPLWLAADESNR
jgi:hypothetical protein